MYFSNLSMALRSMLLLSLAVCLSVCVDNKDNTPNMDTGSLPVTHSSLSNDQITGHNDQANHKLKKLTGITQTLPPQRYHRHVVDTNENSKPSATNSTNYRYNDTQPFHNEVILPESDDNLKGLLDLAKCRVICPKQVSEMVICPIQVSDMIICTIQFSDMIICTIQVRDL